MKLSKIQWDEEGPNKIVGYIVKENGDSYKIASLETIEYRYFHGVKKHHINIYLGGIVIQLGSKGMTHRLYSKEYAKHLVRKFLNNMMIESIAILWDRKAAAEDFNKNNIISINGEPVGKIEFNVTE